WRSESFSFSGGTVADRTDASADASNAALHNAAMLFRNRDMALPFVEHAFQDFAALGRLPHLVLILVFVLIHLEKLLVCLESGFWLVQIIVTERANKPGQSTGRFHFRDLVHDGKRGGIVFRQIVSRA